MRRNQRSRATLMTMRTMDRSMMTCCEYQSAGASVDDDVTTTSESLSLLLRLA